MQYLSCQVPSNPQEYHHANQDFSLIFSFSQPHQPGKASGQKELEKPTKQRPHTLHSPIHCPACSDDVSAVKAELELLLLLLLLLLLFLSSSVLVEVVFVFVLLSGLVL